LTLSPLTSTQPAGPWQPAYVIQLGDDDLYARNVLVDIYREGQLNLLPPDQSKDWILTVGIDYLGKLPSDAALSYHLKDGNSSILSGELTNVTSQNNTITGSVKIPKDAVELWWPLGLGAQKLYNLTIDISGGSKKTVLSVNRRTGFRTIVLNETPISQEQIAQGIAPGNNWHFEVNGHEFYAKGSSKFRVSKCTTPAHMGQISFHQIHFGQMLQRVACGTCSTALSKATRTCSAFGPQEHIHQILCSILRTRRAFCYGRNSSSAIRFIQLTKPSLTM
jgi:hypothetical protein